MHLKSVWTASTLYDPTGAYSLDRYTSELGVPQREPIPLPYFVAYGRWFQEHAVSAVDPTYVRTLARDGQRFHLELADGRALTASQVVVATGIEAFAQVPHFARHLPPTLVTHSQHHKDFARFQGRRVAVLGRGQSAAQVAAFLHEAGAAEVEVIARGPITWINRKLYNATGAARHLFYPSSDVGPAGLSWLIHYAQLYRQLPDGLRARIEARATRPSGAPWLRPRVEGLVRVTPGVEIRSAAAQGDALRLTLSDGTTREVDHLVLGTGYRPHLGKLAFLDPALHYELSDRDGFPILNQWFESSVPQLYFAGAIANYSFGPLCRFVAGTRITAPHIAQRAARRPYQLALPANVDAREEIALAPALIATPEALAPAAEPVGSREEVALAAKA
jgi:cation diffusion facilitator CzcD-associated flavoprotein CzcO